MFLSFFLFFREKLINNASDIIQFAEKQHEEFQSRDDYKEFLELAINILGGVPKRGILFRAPGRLLRAQWIGKVMYLLKICLFRDQFKLSEQEECGIHVNLSLVVKCNVKS
ncbi:hypothetical protein AVEN_226507-1 [Araneus ventricosus]|uniref:Uncharacterized protein n=1 Tax=Araneus ventricosus TaxID=182803 RepID=A0A4Y2QD58_ARAVE|nr:hypothetical protein AVEN_61382-1 [Araneus ventricosus]GBN61301.1 hypothetical protein AVEN_226507-1 [Araneus ventricosus]